MPKVNKGVEFSYSDIKRYIEEGARRDGVIVDALSIGMKVNLDTNRSSEVIVAYGERVIPVKPKSK